MKKLKNTKLYAVLRDALLLYQEKRISRAAAELSYYLTLSIFPFIVCLNVMLGSLASSQTMILQLLNELLPDELTKIINGYLESIQQSDTGLLLAAAIIFLATSSSSAFLSVVNIMADLQGKSRLTGFFGTLLSFFLSFAFLFVVYLSIAILVTGNWFLSVFRAAPQAELLLRYWSWFRFLLLFLIIYAILRIVYRATAPKDGPKIPRKLGAFLAALLLVGASILFSWFIRMSAQYTLVYGSLASLFLMMSWFYTCGLFLISGNVVNLLRAKFRRSTK